MDLLCILESIAATYTEVDNSNKFKHVILQLWTQIALHKSFLNTNFASETLTKIACITPAFRFDQSFALLVRSAALPENLEDFCNDVFKEFDKNRALKHFESLISGAELDKASTLK